MCYDSNFLMMLIGFLPVGFARPAHLDVPINEDRMLARRFADPFLHGKIHHVPCERPVPLLKISAYASRSSVPRYGLQDFDIYL